MTSLADRYRLGAALGRGGVADVYRARDVVLERDVAVKVLRDHVEEREHSRFVAEARTLGRLSHEGIVTVLDVGVSDDGRPYLVMELVEGTTLAAALRDGPLPAERVADVGVRLAGALAYAHAQGVVHRDVKPGNVLLGADGATKLADFGIARLVGDTVGHTRTGTTVGTPAYVSPEQARGERVGPASDVYSLGLVLLEALTGERAFTGTPIESALARLHRPPAIPEDLPPGWRDLVAAMTATDPLDRPTAAEVGARMEVLAASPATRVLPPPAVAAAADEVPTARMPAGLVAGPDRRRRVLLVAAAAALVGVVALVGAVALTGGGTSDQGPGPAPTGTTRATERTTPTPTTTAPATPTSVDTQPGSGPGQPPGQTKDKGGKGKDKSKGGNGKGGGKPGKG